MGPHSSYLGDVMDFALPGTLETSCVPMEVSSLAALY